MGRVPRSITHQLAKETGGRCLGVRFRLSPQSPFPAALIDGLVAYLSLLYPPPGSLHEAVLANDICFAGDSAGGNLVFALLQLILEIRRLNECGTILWFGQQREVPLPAGVSALSPYTDLARALDSEVSNLKYDIIPPRGPPFMGYSHSVIWPASPPRHHVYANDDALCHPLVCQLSAYTEIQKTGSSTFPYYAADHVTNT
jgi:alpha/beta hydrolase fold